MGHWCFNIWHPKFETGIVRKLGYWKSLGLLLSIAQSAHSRKPWQLPHRWSYSLIPFCNIYWPCLIGVSICSILFSNFVRFDYFPVLWPNSIYQNTNCQALSSVSYCQYGLSQAQLLKRLAWSSITTHELCSPKPGLATCFACRAISKLFLVTVPPKKRKYTGMLLLYVASRQGPVVQSCGSLTLG